MNLKILQLTDLHISNKQQIMHGADPKQQFLDSLKSGIALNPDHIVVSGDLSMFDPEPDVCAWVKENLDLTNINYSVIPGNHDDSVQIGKVFHPEHLNERELYFIKRMNGFNIVFLDSARGRFTETQWSWFERTVQNLHSDLYIFMHHPPVFCGVAHMDNNHAFIEQHRFQSLIESLGYPVHIFCGHYHVNRYLHVSNIHIHIAPSTLFQMNAFANEFELESTIPGFSIIELYDQRVITTTEWLNNE